MRAELRPGLRRILRKRLRKRSSIVKLKLGHGCTARPAVPWNWRTRPGRAGSVSDGLVQASVAYASGSPASASFVQELLPRRPGPAGTGPVRASDPCRRGEDEPNLG